MKSIAVDANTFLQCIFDTDSIPKDEEICIARSYKKGNKSSFDNKPFSQPLANRVTSSVDPHYFCVSTVKPQADNELYLKRTRDHTQYAYVIGLDDIGTKATAPDLEPSYKIETSSGNFQWGYRIESYELDSANGEKTKHYEACIQGLIEAGMSDPGATGCYRLLRIPGSINIKPENNGWRSRVTHWEPDRVWRLDELMSALGIEPSYSKAKAANTTNRDTPTAIQTNIKDVLLDWHHSKSLVIKSGDDFQEVICPWAHEHTDGEKTAHYSPKGLGLNGLAKSRQFNCFHAHCSDRNIHDYLDHTKAQGAPDVGAKFDITLKTATKIIDELVKKNDIGDWYEKESMGALIVIKALSTPEYQRIRAKIRETKGLSLTDIEKEMKRYTAEEERQSILTHNGISKALLADMASKDGTDPISCYGELQRYHKGIWTSFSGDDTAAYVASSRYDGKSICRLGSHYQAIAKNMYIQKIDNDFFRAAPKGVATDKHFYGINDKGIIVKSELSRSHRCQFKLTVEPSNQPTPLFDKFLGEIFASSNVLETQQQKLVLQEVIGGALIGGLAQFHKAVIFYGVTRAGKGVLVKIIQAMLPREVISAVSPYKWGHEYHVAAMAGKRLNLCGEFPEDNQIPAAEFKQIVGGDPISGRNPAGRVFTFVADASQIFSCNYLPYCREQSESFYNRWQVIYFPNSVPANRRDPKLADNIIESELGGILQWALDGAARLIKKQRYSESIVHDCIMSEWRIRSDSVAAFCALQGRNQIIEHEKRTNENMPTSIFYSLYEDYCNDEGVKPAGKKTCYARLESIKGIAIKHLNSGDKVILTAP
jgi:P4 family phage/plasmid primase-like protien